MFNEGVRSKLFSRRTVMLAGAKFTLLFALIIRLYYLQIIEKNKFKTLSDSNRIRLYLLAPKRGEILDRNGKPLAENKQSYRILYDPEQAKNKEVTLVTLSKALELDDEKQDKLLKKVQKHRSRSPLLLKEHLSWKEVSRVEVRSSEMPGISIDVGSVRHYPTGELSAHLIGHLGPVSEEIIKTNPLLNHPDFKIGKSGIEKVVDKALRGEAGVKKMEVDAYGLTVRELERESSVNGNNTKLTIDRRLQEFAGKRMQGNSGSVVVLDTRTGDVLTMLSTPGFDPDQFAQGVSQEYWNTLISNQDNPLINKAIANPYPPGSTFKLAVALAILEEGINPEGIIYCPGYVQLGKHRFHCWKKEGHGRMHLTNAIMHSCNSYFYHMARKIGIDKIEIMAKKMGLGSVSGLIIPGEKPGLVPGKEWKEATYHQSWQAGDTLNVGIGQGYMLATPIQLAIMVARVASGREIIPRITFPQNSDNPYPVFNKLDLPEKHLQLVRKGMYRVVNIPGGTAYGSRITNKSFTMAGKTGTSQVISKKYFKANKHKMTEEQIHRSQNHALFTGYAPFDKPRYAISVVVEHGGGGSKAAAPVGRDILHEAQKLRVGSNV